MASCRRGKTVDGNYKVLGYKDYDPEDEEWEFPPGSIVQCEQRETADGLILAAVKMNPQAKQ